INGACRSGLATPQPPPVSCKRGMVGTPPNCSCPPGQVLTRTGQCRADVVVGCPSDRPVGKPPYCCPRGTQYLNGACRSGTATPQPRPQQQACTGGRTGTPPNCNCPSGSSYSALMARRTRGRRVCATATTSSPNPAQLPSKPPQTQCSMERVCAQWGKGPP